MKKRLLLILCTAPMGAVFLQAKNSLIEHHKGIKLKRMAQLDVVNKDLALFFGGKLKDDLFVQNRCYTLRSDYNDQQDFFRHKLELDAAIAQGVKRYGKPASQAGVRLSNYVLWQNESNYTPLYIDQIALPEAGDVAIAKNVPVKTVVPLIYVEEAWFKLNFDTFLDNFKDNKTFLKVGYFGYQLGRGVAMGVHKDLAIDYLGWGGEGGFTRYPVMPPGILLHHGFTDNFSVEAYFNLWRETNASLMDTLKPVRAAQLTGPQPERGSGRDTWSFSLRGDYTADHEMLGKVLVQPYAMYTKAPEQTIEIFADASSKLMTFGTMVDWQKNNLTINMELALQVGSQQVHALDRNQLRITAGAEGGISRSFSHIQAVNVADGIPENPTTVSLAPAGDRVESQFPNNDFEPNKNTVLIVGNDENRGLIAQGTKIQTNGRPEAVQVDAAYRHFFNSNVFGNKRFRPAYRLDNRGVMFLTDVIYNLESCPVSLAAAVGYISGDQYPYNDETSRTFSSFIPQRSRYLGYGVKSFLMFDRMIVPRPLNISYRNLYAYNNLKDLGNMQFLGFGVNWFPFEKRTKGSCGVDVMLLGETAELKKWDVKGVHPDPLIEAQLSRLRNTFNGEQTLFQGWESTKSASKFLGIEIDTHCHYQLLDHCDAFMRVSVFLPGQLYKDLNGQPNILTRRTDKDGFLRYDSLGASTAFAFNVGLKYRF